MPMITFVCPDQLSERIDRVVRELKSRPKHTPTPQELKTAKSISKTQGVPAANEYLRRLQSTDRHSRTSFILDILETHVPK